MRIDYSIVFVSDMKRSIEFYRDIECSASVSLCEVLCGLCGEASS